MSSKKDRSSLFELGTALFQNRFNYQFQEYKYIGIEKGSKIAATAIVVLLVLLAFISCVFFGSILLGIFLTQTTGSPVTGFGIVFLIYIGIFILTLLFSVPLRWILKELLIALLDKRRGRR